MKIIGYIILLAGVWMMVCPGSLIGLKQLRWLHQYSIPAGALIGAFVIAASFLLLKTEKVDLE